MVFRAPGRRLLRPGYSDGDGDKCEGEETGGEDADGGKVRVLLTTAEPGVVRGDHVAHGAGAAGAWASIHREAGRWWRSGRLR